MDAQSGSKTYLYVQNHMREARTFPKSLIFVVFGSLIFEVMNLSAMFLSLTCVTDHEPSSPSSCSCAHACACDPMMTRSLMRKSWMKMGSSGGTFGATKSMSVKIEAGSAARPSRPGGGSTVENGGDHEMSTTPDRQEES